MGHSEDDGERECPYCQDERAGWHPCPFHSKKKRAEDVNLMDTEIL